MTVNRGKPAKHSRSSRRDKAAIAIVTHLLANSDNFDPELKNEDTTPNLDGYINLLNKEELEIGKVAVQVKTLKKIKSNRRISHYLKNPFLSYCLRTRQFPVIFIGVDQDNGVAYWKEMTKDVIKTMQGNTVQLDPAQIITKENHSCYGPWRKRVLEISKAIEDSEEKKRGEQEGHVIHRKGDRRILKKAAAGIKSLFVDNELKYKYFYAFVNLLEPFCLDLRGEMTRRKLRALFEITRTQEEYFIRRLKREKLIRVVGGICLVLDSKKAALIQNEMITSRAITLDEILRIFY